MRPQNTISLHVNSARAFFIGLIFTTKPFIYKDLGHVPETDFGNNRV